MALIDHYKELGEKIRISGGGRCNFTNLHATHRDFLSRNPDFCRSALARYTPRDFIALVEKHRIAYHEKTLGQLFCDDSSKQIIEMMRSECDEGRVEWMRPCPVGAVVARRRRLSHRHGRWAPCTRDHSSSRPAGSRCRRSAQHPSPTRSRSSSASRSCEPKPALVPLAIDPTILNHYGELAGVSLDVEVSCAGGRFRESMLFTHRGLSGPSILQTSSYWQFNDAQDPLHVNLLPGLDARAFLADNRQSPSTLATLLANRWPARFAQIWCAQMQATLPMAQLPERKVQDLAVALSDWRIQPNGTLGYNKAEVTLGGVDTRGLSSKTMEARERAWIVLHRRGRGCHRAPRRLQLPVGVGLGAGRGRSRLVLDGDDVRLDLAVDRASPKRWAMAFAATSVASPSRAASRASISLRSGVPWQYAIAGMRGDAARLRSRDGVDLRRRRKPPLARSRSIAAWSW